MDLINKSSLLSHIMLCFSVSLITYHTLIALVFVLCNIKYPCREKCSDKNEQQKLEKYVNDKCIYVLMLATMIPRTNDYVPYTCNSHSNGKYLVALYQLKNNMFIGSLTKWIT